jgi:hypothetical protein
LNKRLPDIKAELICERLETNAWNTFYEPYVNSINKLNINTIIPEWTGKKYSQLINIGILKIENNNFIDIYLSRWEKFKAFIIEHQNELVKKQKELVESKNKEVMDSINYAKRIQQSILPTSKYIDSSLKRLKRDNF